METLKFCVSTCGNGKILGMNTVIFVLKYNGVVVCYVVVLSCKARGQLLPFSSSTIYNFIPSAPQKQRDHSHLAHKNIINFDAFLKTILHYKDKQTISTTLSFQRKDAAILHICRKLFRRFNTHSSTYFPQ